MKPHTLSVQLLGAFSLTYCDQAVTGIQSARQQSLLTYLILRSNAPQLRQQIAFQLWPETTDSQARNNLRQLLHQLRQALPDSDRFLNVDTNAITWKTDEEQTVDLLRFQQLIREAEFAEQQSDVGACRQRLEEAIDHYQGDLLPGCYDDWITPERERHRGYYRNACLRLMSLLEDQREYSDAILAAQRLNRWDPLDEETCAALIRLHSLNGDSSAARRVYLAAVDTLRRELDSEPGSVLQSAYQRLQKVPRSATFKESDGSISAFRLVGRLDEWHSVQGSWQRSISGEAHLCLITGEAGIGKSRLAEELQSWVERQGFTTAQTRSYGVEGNLSLAPITALLRSEGLRPHLNSLDTVWLTEIARLLPELLGDSPHIPRPEPITEYGRRQRFFEALARGVLAAPQPLLLRIDDLHWCDPETLEWLHFLLRFEPSTNLLIVGTARSEETPPDHPLSGLLRHLHAEERAKVVELSPLDAAETAKLASVVHGHVLTDEDYIRLYRETEGNPLFVVEAVRAGLTPSNTLSKEPAIGAGSPSTSLPPRVQAIISGRLSQLSPAARTVAEIGAAIGRAFTLDLLLLSGNEKEEVAIAALDELWVRRIVREQSPNVFDFTHDKLREVTGTETSLPQRRLLHRRIAQALVTLHIEDPDSVSAQIAAHFEQAGLFEQAIPHYEQAGATAAGVYANDDAIHLYNRGLELLKKLPASTQRDARELAIQLALTKLYRISKGWTSPEQERAINRVMLLSEKVGNRDQRIRALFGLQSLYVVQAEFEKVERTYAQVEGLFADLQNTPPVFAKIYLAGAKLHTGKIDEARERFEQIIAARNDQHIRDLQESQGLNYVVHSLAWGSHAQWCLGYPDTAHNSARTSMELAIDNVEPFNQALSVTYRAMVETWRSSPEIHREFAENAVRLTQDYKAPYYSAWSNIQLRYSEAMLQSDDSSLAKLRMAIDNFMATGARIRLPLYFSMLAEVCSRVGRIEEGLEALEMALAESIQNDEHWWDSEIHRLRAELMAAQGAAAEDIESAYVRSIIISKSQKARSLELRAVISRARWNRQRSRETEVKQHLIDIYGSFDEGFDTSDLLAAKALLQQL